MPEGLGCPALPLTGRLRLLTQKRVFLANHLATHPSQVLQYSFIGSKTDIFISIKKNTHLQCDHNHVLKKLYPKIVQGTKEHFPNHIY